MPVERLLATGSEAALLNVALQTAAVSNFSEFRPWIGSNLLTGLCTIDSRYLGYLKTAADRHDVTLQLRAEKEPYWPVYLQKTPPAWKPETTEVMNSQKRFRVEVTPAIYRDLVKCLLEAGGCRITDSGYLLPVDRGDLRVVPPAGVNPEEFQPAPIEVPLPPVPCDEGPSADDVEYRKPEPGEQLPAEPPDEDDRC